MQRFRLVVLASCVLVVLGTVVAAWLEARPHLDRADARDFAARALHGAGVSDVHVRDQVDEAIFVSERGGEPRPVWIATADVPGGSLKLWIDRERAAAVKLDDTNGSGYLLSDAQVSLLTTRHGYQSLDDRVLRNYLVSFAGLLAASVASALALLTTIKPRSLS